MGVVMVIGRLFYSSYKSHCNSVKIIHKLVSVNCFEFQYVSYRIILEIAIGQSSQKTEQNMGWRKLL